jgi:hypothetical protein
MSVSHDLRAMNASAALLMGVPRVATLQSGAMVEVVPGWASANDTVLGTPGTINGDERTLSFIGEDAQGLKAGSPLTWNDKAWKVKHPQILANGALVKVFLQEMF